ncbi:MAG TPA: LysR substrate-binding domain-containing protein [Gemmatimonadaceae bacterium]|nr:LysR substrate-binding domain-containing protein [Gemmatimonadaceae bacterium]
MRDDALDAGRVAIQCRDLGVEERPLLSGPFVACVGPGQRLEGRPALAPEDPLLDDTLLVAEGHCFRDQVVGLCRARAAGRPRGDDGEPERASLPLRFESGNLETLRQLAERGHGMTLLPYLATLGLTEAERTRLVPFVAPTPARILTLVHHRACLERRIISALCDEQLAALPAALR